MKNYFNFGFWNQTVNLQDAAYTVHTGSGHDTVNTGSGNDYINTGLGNDTVNSGSGHDTIYTGIGNDIVNSGEGNDVIHTGIGHDVVDAGNGNNYVNTGLGNDDITTGNGNDSILAGAGADVISTGQGNDHILAGAGNDYIAAGEGSDTVYGLTGDDTFVHNFENSSTKLDYDRYYGGIGRDKLVLNISAEDLQREDVQSDLVAFEAHNRNPWRKAFSPFNFTSMSLSVVSIEEIELNVLTAANDYAEVSENADIVVDVLDNDTLTSNEAFKLVSANLVGDVGIMTTTDGKIAFNTNDQFDHLQVGETQDVTIEYTIENEYGIQSKGNLTVTVTGTNDAPVATAVNAAVIENNIVEIDVLSGVTDVDNDQTELKLISANLVDNKGYISISDNKLVFEANQDFDYLAEGEITTVDVEFTVADPAGAIATETATITVTGTNDAPFFDYVYVSGIYENETETLNILASASDLDSDTLHVQSVRVLGDKGLAYIDEDEQLVFDTNSDFDYLDKGESVDVNVEYTVVDDKGAIATEQSTVTIQGIQNKSIIAQHDYVTTTANGKTLFDFTTVGDARYSTQSEYIITDNQYDQRGALWTTQKLDLTKAFTSTVQLYFGNNDSGADGFSFILQNKSNQEIGAPGRGLGYEGINNSFGIEFDTYYNSSRNDIYDDHTAFLQNGSVTHSSSGMSAPVSLGNIEDGMYHDVKVTWTPNSDGNDGEMSLYFDNPNNAIKTETINLAELIGDQYAYAGYSGSTGGAKNKQKINMLEIEYDDKSVIIDPLINDVYSDGTVPEILDLLDIGFVNNDDVGKGSLSMQNNKIIFVPDNDSFSDLGSNEKDIIEIQYLVSDGSMEETGYVSIDVFGI